MTYEVELSDGTSFQMSGDFSQASSPLTMHWEWNEEDEWTVTPFQVADAGHLPLRAARMLCDWSASAEERGGLTVVAIDGEAVL